MPGTSTHRFSFTQRQIASNKTPRKINRSLVFNLIRTRQPISRADLARVSGLQRSTVSLIVEDLIQSGWIVEGALGQLPRGRRPTFLQLNEARRPRPRHHPSQTTVAVAGVGRQVVSQQVVVVPEDSTRPSPPSSQRSERSSPPTSPAPSTASASASPAAPICTCRSSSSPPTSSGQSSASTPRSSAPPASASRWTTPPTPAPSPKSGSAQRRHPRPGRRQRLRRHRNRHLRQRPSPARQGGMAGEFGHVQMSPTAHSAPAATTAVGRPSPPTAPPSATTGMGGTKRHPASTPCSKRAKAATKPPPKHSKRWPSISAGAPHDRRRPRPPRDRHRRRHHHRVANLRSHRRSRDEKALALKSTILRPASEGNTARLRSAVALVLNEGL